MRSIQCTVAMATLPKVNTKLNPLYSSANIFNWTKMYVFWWHMPKKYETSRGNGIIFQRTSLTGNSKISLRNM